MQRFGSARDRRGTGGGAVLVAVLCLLPGSALAQSAGPLSPPPRLSAADLPELTLASSDGLRIGRAALPEAVPQLPPPRTAARVPVPRLAPADPDVVALAPVPPVALAPVDPGALPHSTSLALALLAPVAPAAAARAEDPPLLPVVLAAPAPQARAAVSAAAPVVPGRLAPVTPAPLPPRWLDPQDPADRAMLEALFGAALPPGLALEPPEPADPGALALAVQTELQRLNCYPGALDGDWGRGSRTALEAYGKATGAMPDTLDPTPALLRQLQARPEGKLCPDPARPKPAATAAPATKQQAKPAPKQQPAAKPAPKQQPAKPAKKQPDIAIIGL